MIPITKMRLYPFKTKTLAFPDKRGIENYDIIYFPENTTFYESYFKLKIKRMFARKATIAKAKIPVLIVNGKTLAPYRALKLLPVIDIKEDENNTFIDSSQYMEALDAKFKKGSYRRPIVGNRVISYLQACKAKSPPNRKTILVYHIDYDKEFPKEIQYRRVFPLVWQLQKTKGFSFDYVLLAMSSGGSTVYTALKNETDSLPFGRVFSLIKGLDPRIPEQIVNLEEKKPDIASEKVVNKLVIADETEHSKLKDVVSNYLGDSGSLKVNRIVDRDDIPVDALSSVAAKSILYAVSGDKKGSEDEINKVPIDKRREKLQDLKDDLLPEIVEKNQYENSSRDGGMSDVNNLQINNKKEPSKVLNKRKVDFDVTFEKDMINSFKTLAKQGKFPLKIKSVKKSKVPVEPGNMKPSKSVRYTFVLTGENGKDHEIDIEVPQIQDDGSFLINGNKSFIIYQVILDPIYFIKEGLAKLETLYAAVSVHHKKTKYKSYYESRTGGFELPLILVLSYYMGFKQSMNLFGIKYKVSNEQPSDDSLYLSMTDNTWFLFENLNESQLRFINSFKEIPYKFTSETINDHSEIEKAIVSFTSNRNSIYVLGKVLKNIMEPVSVQILKTKLLPYTYPECIKYMADELAKGRVDKRNDLSHQRVRSSEVFAHQISKAIQTSYSEYESRRTVGDKDAEFRCDTRKIVQDIVNSQLMRPLENINPYEELSSLTRITPVGIGGLNDARGLTTNDRSIHESYYGNIDPMDTPEGGTIGVINQLTVDATITNARGSFKTKDGVDDKSGMLSPNTAVIPYIGSCDGARAMLACSQTKQALPIHGNEQPLVQTGYETIMTTMLSDSYIRKSPADGTVVKISENSIHIKDITGKIHKVSVDQDKLRSLQGQSSLNILSPVVKVGQKVKVGQIMAEGKHIKDGVISVGTNLLVGIMGWKGYAYEDGYIISDRIAKQKLSSESYQEITVFISKTDSIKFINEEGKDTRKGEPLIIRTSKDIEALAGLDDDELVEGQIIKKSPGGKIVSMEIYPNISLKQFPELIPQFDIFKKKYEETKGPFPEKFFEVMGGRKEYLKGIKIVFNIERVEESIVGDKLANNHGGKGVITYIEKAENMPVTPWGQPLDIILNPLAIIGRMNPSTIFEMYTGLIGKLLAYKIVKSTKEETITYIQSIYSALDKTENQKLSKQIIKGYTSMSAAAYNRYQKKIVDDGYIVPIIIPQFQNPSKEDIEKALKLIGGQNSYHLKLPEYGKNTKNKIAIGYLYYKKLEAQSEGKLSARSVGKYRGSTMQPVAGKKAGGGLRIGEFDTWAIIDHGAENVLRELFGPLSDDHETKNQIISDIIQNGEAAYREPKRSTTRDLMNVYLHGMMLDTTIGD